MLEIQKWLSEPGTLEDRILGLGERYAIKAKQHPAYPNLWLFKYDQINSPFAEQIVRECRGIILDADNHWRVVSRAFDKFFNHGEGHAAEIAWTTAQVQEKVDGSLCVVYPYDGKWHVATSGSPDAGGDVHGAGYTFAEYFWKTFEAQGGSLPTNPGFYGCCFYFEITGPDNRIVVVHEKSRLTSLGMRDLRGNLGELGSYGCQLATNIPAVREFGLQSFEDIATSFATMSPLSQEGYVVVDQYYNRVKVKHPGYVALHHAKDGMTRKAFAEIVRNGETSEVLAAFPEFKPIMDEVKIKYEALVNATEADYTAIQGVASDKEFAQEALKTRCSAALFSLRRKKTSSIRRFFAEIRIDFLLQLLDSP